MGIITISVSDSVIFIVIVIVYLIAILKAITIDSLYFYHLLHYFQPFKHFYVIITINLTPPLNLIIIDHYADS